MATNEDIARLGKAFPQEQILTVNKRGTNLSYVSHSEVTRRLLEVDPNWYIQIAYVDENGGPVYEKCQMSGTPTGAWFILTICDVSKYVFGSYDPPVKADIKAGLQDGTIKWSPLMDPDAPKKILSDAISTGAARWGVGLQLWSKATPEKSAEQEKGKLLNDLRAKVQAGGPALTLAVKNYLNTRQVVDLSDEEFDGFVKLVENFKASNSSLVVDFMVKYATLDPSVQAAIVTHLESNGSNLSAVSDDDVRSLESAELL